MTYLYKKINLDAAYFRTCSFPSLDMDLASTEQASSDKASSTPTGDELLFEDGHLTPVQREGEELESVTREEVVGSRGREASMSDDGISVPSPIPEVDESMHNDGDEVGGVTCLYSWWEWRDIRSL